MNLQTFEKVREVADLSKKYDERADSSDGEKKIIYTEFVDTLDVLHDKLLGIGLFNTANHIDEECLMNKSVNEISSYTRVHLIKKYPNGLGIVQDTGGGLFLVPLTAINYVMVLGALCILMIYQLGEMIDWIIDKNKESKEEK